MADVVRRERGDDGFAAPAPADLGVLTLVSARCVGPGTKGRRITSAVVLVAIGTAGLVGVLTAGDRDRGVLEARLLDRGVLTLSAVRCEGGRRLGGFGVSLSIGTGCGPGATGTVAGCGCGVGAGLVASAIFRRLCISACCRRSRAAACSRTIAAAMVAAEAMLPRLPLCCAAACLAASFETSIATRSASSTAADVRCSMSSASFALRAARLACATTSARSSLLSPERARPRHLSSPSGETGKLDGRCCA